MIVGEYAESAFKSLASKTPYCRSASVSRNCDLVNAYAREIRDRFDDHLLHRTRRLVVGFNRRADMFSQREHGRVFSRAIILKDARLLALTNQLARDFKAVRLVRSAFQSVFV